MILLDVLGTIAGADVTFVLNITPPPTFSTFGTAAATDGAAEGAFAAAILSNLGAERTLLLLDAAMF